MLGFNVGISQSYATLGQIGFAERSGYTAMGNVCNLAARFCDIYAKELHASEVYKMPCRRVRRKLPQRKFAMPFAITAREFGINHEATWKPAIEQMGNAGRPMAVGLKDWRAC